MMEQKIGNQYFLKGLLILQTLGLVIYTIIAIKNDGSNFLGKAQEFVLSMKWMGQFALDFQCYLMLSSLWILWRNKYSVHSIVLAIIAMIMGIVVFAPYLLYLLIKEKGNLIKLLIGNRT